MILIDSCVLIDVLDQDPEWRHWSANQLDKCLGHGFVDAVVLAELHGRLRAAGMTDRLLAQYALECLALPGDVAPIAGAAFRLYRERGGRSGAMLADFLIGAHALHLKATLLTRDRARFARYFPELVIISPESDAP